MKTNVVDDFLNRITMYRLMLYYLIVLLSLAFLLSLSGVLPYSPLAILISTAISLAVCLLANALLSRIFGATPNIESSYISALILTLIITPELSWSAISFVAWAGLLAMVSKFILSYRHKHLFNPAAISVVATALIIHHSASWWVGTVSMLPAVIVGGILIVRKIRRADLVWAFIITALVVSLGTSLLHGNSLAFTAKAMLLYSPLLFFAFVMLIEPSTSPPNRSGQIWYGVMIGLLFNPSFHFDKIYATPELALVVGNIFSFIISPKGRIDLRLKEIRQIGADTREFIFQPSYSLGFTPGQYLELTLNTPHSDARGNRRFFTIASSPTEDDLRFGIKFYPQGSRFKQVLAALKPGEAITAAQRAGNFTLPNSSAKKLAFIAGGIGITPFRSQIQFLVDKQQKRDIVLLYSNKTASEIVYADIFSRAEPMGLKVFYTLTNVAKLPKGWSGGVGVIDQEMLTAQIPDYKERLFYLSGPHAMVVAFEQLLHSLGVARSQIKVDYFPGYV